jgi:hypothetical protein
VFYSLIAARHRPEPAEASPDPANGPSARPAAADLALA